MTFKEISKDLLKEIIIILIASVILGFAVSFPDSSIVVMSTICFIIIIALNILVKKLMAYYYEADLKIGFWKWRRFGFAEKSYFKRAIPMLWLPLFFSLITKGFFWWLGLLVFDVSPKTERVSKRHGLYRFSQMVEWHVALIAVSGILINLLLSVIGYLLGFEFFARLNIYFAVWSIIPITNLDGSKIFFGSRYLWFTILVVLSIFLGYSLIVI
jgi:hypothetical protein